MPRIVMEIPDFVRFKLQSLIWKYENMNQSVHYQNQQISSIKNLRYTRSSNEKLEQALEKKNQLFLKQCKSIRATFLYLNKNKKLIFGFNNKTSSFWKTVYIRKNALICQCQRIIDNNEFTEEIRKYLSLTIKTFKNYDENYGLNIGLVLNRLFCKDISWTIYEYL
jgi:hypothetical protein